MYNYGEEKTKPKKILNKVQEKHTSISTEKMLSTQYTRGYQIVRRLVDEN